MDEKEVVEETRTHIREVQRLLVKMVNMLMFRGKTHDRSKLGESELPIFVEYTPKLRGLTYGSPEYQRCLDEMSVALNHHYTENRHHPEHFKLNSFFRCPKCNKEYHVNAPKKCTTTLPQSSGNKLCGAESKQVFTLNGMNLVDIVEMFCDWLAATQRHADGDIMKSIEQNQKRFGYSDDIAAIFRNTVGILTASPYSAVGKTGLADDTPYFEIFHYNIWFHYKRHSGCVNAGVERLDYLLENVPFDDISGAVRIKLRKELRLLLKANEVYAERMKLEVQ